jgi:serine protease
MAKNIAHAGSNELAKPTWPPGYIRRVVVKFRDTMESSEIPYDERVEQNPEQYLGQNWIQLLEQFPGITIQRLITSVTSQQIQELVNRAKKRRGVQVSTSLRPIRRGRERNQNDEPPNFLTYFSVPCPAGVEPQAVAEALRKWRWTEQAERNPEDHPGAGPRQRGIEVELAYVESGPAPPPNIILSPEEDPRQEGTQNYLTPAPVGIDAEYAWTIAGGDGDTGVGAAGLQFVDIEQGWTIMAPTLNPVLTEDHEDLPVGIQCVWGVPLKYLGHGTGVLGIVLAVPGNADGTKNATERGCKNCVGITPKVQNRMVASIWPDISGTSIERVNAIMYVIGRLNPGDVLLLEDQIWAYGSYKGYMKNWNRCPLEIEDALNDAIWLATSNDIVVIEAAGNWGIDLDAFIPDGNFWDWETNSAYSNGVLYWKSKRDSGAIMVAAGDSISHDPAGSNRGSRIDCFAWGDGISTTGNPDPNRTNYPGPQDYTVGFSGTSGASAIIAGAALAIQGIAQVHLKGDLSNKRFSPSQLRSILRDWKTGTVSINSSKAIPPTPPNWNVDKIGVMPDLRNIINNTLKIRPLKKLERKRYFKKPKRHRGPGIKKQALRKTPAKAKKKSLK